MPCICRQGSLSEGAVTEGDRAVSYTHLEDGKDIFEEQGEMLFTHFGISGPLTLSASSHLGDMKKHSPLFIAKIGELRSSLSFRVIFFQMTKLITGG